jgi:hypothetical protein
MDDAPLPVDREHRKSPVRHGQDVQLALHVGADLAPVPSARERPGFVDWVFQAIVVVPVPVGPWTPTGLGFAVRVAMVSTSLLLEATLGLSARDHPPDLPLRREEAAQ